MDTRNQGENNEILCENKLPSAEPVQKPAMLVKVNLVGVVFTRKINLANYDNYQSFYHGLHKLFRNFDKVYDPNESSGEHDDDHLAFYSLNNTGEITLIGGIPWELFVATVERIYIVDNTNNADEEDDYSDQEAEEIEDQADGNVEK